MSLQTAPFCSECKPTRSSFPKKLPLACHRRRGLTLVWPFGHLGRTRLQSRCGLSSSEKRLPSYLKGILGHWIFPFHFSVRSGGFRETSGNIRLNTSPLILSGSCFGESFGWASSLLAKDSGSGDFASSGIIAAPYISTNTANFEHTLPVCSSRPI
jgi:hypothetical protein